MPEIPDLYQTLILEHAQNPRNAHFPEGANRSAQADNPLCGDSIELKLAMDGDVITAAGFTAVGCAISKASASLMTEAVRGKTSVQARELNRAICDLVAGKIAAEAADLGDLNALGGVTAFPMRRKCATLAWQALLAALAEDGPASDSEPD